MPALCNTQKAELVPRHRVFCFILCFAFFVRILIQRVESYSLCFLQSMPGGLLFAPVHFLVHALAWQAEGMGRCSAFRAVRRLGSFKEKPLWSGLGQDTSYRRASLSSWLEAAVAERWSTGRKGRRNSLITQARSSKGYRQWDITSLLAVAIFL